MMKWRFIILAAVTLPTLLLIFSRTNPSMAQTSSLGGPTFEQRVLEIVNQERWQNGQLPPLKGETTLNDAADTHSTNMAIRNFFSHCDLDTGSSPWDRMEDAGYTNWSYAGENIAAGYHSPESVMAAWMNSSGHRSNILSTEYREVGIGYFYQGDDQNNIRQDNNGDCQADTANNGPYYHYWTQNFGRRNEVMPVIINREAHETNGRHVNLYLYGWGWAHSMRLRNEGENWSSWQSFTADTTWTLSCGNGNKTVFAEISSGPNGAGTVRNAQDDIYLNSGDGTLSLTPGALSFVAHTGNGPDSLAQILRIENVGGQSLNWAITENPQVNWLDVALDAGQLEACEIVDVLVTADITGLALGVYHTTLTITDKTTNTTWEIPVTLLYTDQPPVYLPTVLK
jgi:uncharacterized protein YkwD